MEAVSIVFFLLCLASLGWARLGPRSGHVFNVADFGAFVNGPTGDTQAFIQAWNASCTTYGPSKVTIPAGKTIMLNPLSIEGPCKSEDIHIQVLGNIVGPKDISAWGSDKSHWIRIHKVNGLTVEGSGQIDGQGSIWWDCRSSKQCDGAPTTLAILNSNNVTVSGLNMVNSPQKHLGLEKCNGVLLSHLNITAPEDSPNTDGIHISGSQNVEILDSTIGTGDDCISIGTGCSDVNISRIVCGPGHGISIGSLGSMNAMNTVEKVHVKNCSFKQTTNGARIKTWQGGSGFARDILFENLNFKSVKTPIVIDQYYCNGDHNCPNKTSAVKVSDVSFIGLRGTTSKEVPISLACSETVPCKGILLDNVHFTSDVPGLQLSSYCLNAYGSANAVIPNVDFLS
ncbi:putative polygalacturonase At3g15720 [Tasmannia lanceolata]|uniref:putative polygalacturonase At3g15720 n=1 Tax=Tasmannia lanceolata TaxID=3420 RepID=UPI00406301DD